MSNNKSRSPISSNKPSFLTNHKRLDPITPSNNSSDFLRRCSLEKERDFDEKENDKDQNFKALKLRSPAKNSKNFMSPTISAASKFTPSPKKKILVERNDPLRTSISLCNGKATFFSSINSDVECDDNQIIVTSLDLNEKKETVCEVPFVMKPKKRVTFADFHSTSNPEPESGVTYSVDNLRNESELKNRVLSSPVSSCVASPNPDSSLRPYDPKTNYLSPRPQFLHYKPNPKIGILLDKDKLEDDFLEEIMCGAFSDSESTEGSSQSEHSQMEEAEFNDRYDMVNGFDETEEYSLESCESSTVSNVVSSDNLALKKEKKSRGFIKVACFSILLVFLIACVSVVTHPDQIGCSGMGFSDLSSYYHEFKVSASEKASFEKLARHVIEFSDKSVTFISKLISKHGKAEKIGPLKFMNITDLQVSIWNEDHFRNNPILTELVDDDLEQDEVEEDLNAETYSFEPEVDSAESSEIEVVEDLEEDDGLENDITEIEEEPLVKVTADKDGDRTEIEEESLVKVSSDYELSDLVTTTDSDSENSAFVENKTEVISPVNTEEITFEAENIEVAAETTKAVETEGAEKATILHNENTVASDISSEASQSLLKTESPFEKTENKLAHYIFVFTSLIGALLGVAALVYKLKRSHRSGNIVEETKSFSREQIRQENRISKNLQPEVEESCSTEMSSFNSTVYAKKALKGETEAQSFEGKPRRYSKRESLASSSVEYSTGAVSYGSFTTFERIPIGEDEIITPVRRSSRLRKQVTSP